MQFDYAVVILLLLLDSFSFVDRNQSIENDFSSAGFTSGICRLTDY